MKGSTIPYAPYDPENPPVGGIPADPLPDDLPEGDSGDVADEDAVAEFENFEADDYQEDEIPDG